MCGIFGIADRRGPPADALLAAQAASLAHRGPDGMGYSRGSVSVGNTRLAIIDPAGGRQPVSSDDGKIHLVQNGEIYNYVELMAALPPGVMRTHSDTEVLLRLYEREGLAFIHRLNGMFAIAISDERSGQLHLIRDRFGVKPLYIHNDGQRLVFGSEIKTLLAAGVPRAVNVEAIALYLQFNYVPPPITMFQGIRHLAPGSALSWSLDGSIKEWQWYKGVQQASVGPVPSDYTDRILALLDDSVRLRLRADVPFGAFLSGGIDSTTVVGLMKRHLSQPVRSSSIGFTDPAWDESPYANAAAQRFGTRHDLAMLGPELLHLWPAATWHCDQPHGDVSFMPMLHLARMTRAGSPQNPGVKMVLTGDGGDELFAGYEKHLSFFSTDGKPAALPNDWIGAYAEHTGLFRRPALEKLWLGKIPGISAADICRNHIAQVPQFDPVAQALWLDVTLLLPGNNLVKPDRMSMAAGLETREPFLDYRLAELAFSIPGTQHLQGGMTKALLKKAVAPIIGPELAFAPKRMFTVPIAAWLRGPLLATLHAALLEKGGLADRGILNPAAMATLITEHCAGTANRTRELRALLSLEIWFRLFIDNSYQRPPDFSTLGLPKPLT